MRTKAFNTVIALLIGILMNPILFAIVFIVDSAGNSVLKGTLLERTPFAYIYFWAGAFLPDNPVYDEAKLWLIVIANTILYTALSYIVLSRSRSDSTVRARVLGFCIGIMIFLILNFLLSFETNAFSNITTDYGFPFPACRTNLSSNDSRYVLWFGLIANIVIALAGSFAIGKGMEAVWSKIALRSPSIK